MEDLARTRVADAQPQPVDVQPVLVREMEQQQVSGETSVAS